MFKTLSAVKILVNQKLYDEAVDILNQIENDGNRQKVLYLKAVCFEGLNKTAEAEAICYKLIDENYIHDNVYEILEKIYTKTKREIKTIEVNLPEDELASAYEKIGDLENSIKWYYKKIQSLKQKLEEEND